MPNSIEGWKNVESFERSRHVGSLRKASWTRKIALALADLAPPTLRVQIVEVGDLPLYNEDIESETPSPWVRFRNEVRPANAVLFAAPEYNRSVPGVLKNAIDVGSRPYRASVWDGKPGAVVSVSPGAIGAHSAPIIICVSRLSFECACSSAA